ncbi:unnamed protein product [Caenorhabditis nigoni]
MVIQKLAGLATGQVPHQSPIPVPQDPIADPQPLDPEIIRLREENKRLTDRIAALYDLHPISHEDHALLQKGLGGVKEAKTRLETENMGQKLELERSWRCQRPQRKPWNGTRKCSKASESFLNDLTSNASCLTKPSRVKKKMENGCREEF